MTEATYTYYPTASPMFELFDCTTAPTNGLKLTSRKFTNPQVVGYTWAEAPAAADYVSFTNSGSVITVAVGGTARKIKVLVTEGV